MRRKGENGHDGKANRRRGARELPGVGRAELLQRTGGTDRRRFIRARGGTGRRHRSGWKTGRPPPLVRGGVRPCPRRPHRAPARGRGGFPPSQPAHRPPARTRRHGPTRPSLSAARPHARGQPPPGTFLPRALLYTRQRPPPCPRRRAAADDTPYDPKPLSDAGSPAYRLRRARGIARSEDPPWRNSGRS